MQNIFKNNDINQNINQNTAELKVIEYINKYLQELQRHFDISDRKMRYILYKIYKDSSLVNKFIKSVKNKFSVAIIKYVKKRNRKWN